MGTRGCPQQRNCPYNLETPGTAPCLVPPLLQSKQCCRQYSLPQHKRPVHNPVCWLSRLVQDCPDCCWAAPTPKESGQGGSIVFPIMLFGIFSNYAPPGGGVAFGTPMHCCSSSGLPEALVGGKVHLEAALPACFC